METQGRGTVRASYEVEFAPAPVPLGSLVLLGGIVACGAASMAVAGASSVALVILLVGFVLLMAAHRRAAFRRGPLVVDDDAVEFAEQQIADRGAVTAALVAPNADGACIDLWSGPRPLGRMRVESADVARRLVASLGLAPGERVTGVEVPGEPPALAAAYLVLGVGAVALSAWLSSEGRSFQVSMVLSLAALGAAAVWRATRKQLEIGVDGLRVTSNGAERFIGWRDVAEVGELVHPFSGVVLVLRSGRRVRFATHARQGDMRRGLADALRAAIALGETSPSELDLARLRRGDRDVAAWLRELRALGAGGGVDHRRAPAPEDSLWSAVASSAARPEERAAAAVALAEDERRRPRLRVLAGAIAMPNVRIAVEAAARGADEEELAAALLEVENEGGGAEPPFARSYRS